jgi:hypothetical protein
MLGLPINSWVRFFVYGSVAGFLLWFLPIKPIAQLGFLVMLLGLAGVAVVAIYARTFLPWTWRRWLVMSRYRLWHLAHANRRPRLHRATHH